MKKIYIKKRSNQSNGVDDRDLAGLWIKRFMGGRVELATPSISIVDDMEVVTDTLTYISPLVSRMIVFCGVASRYWRYSWGNDSWFFNHLANPVVYTDWNEQHIT